MDLFSMLSGLKNTLAKPKFYSIVLQTNAGAAYQGSYQFLYHGVAYSLEEAISEAKMKMKADAKLVASAEEILNATAVLYYASPVSKLLEPFIDREMRKVPVKSEESEAVVKVKNKDPKQRVNILMKKIVDTKDRELLEKNRGKFSEPEIKYLEKMLGR